MLRRARLHAPTLGRALHLPNVTLEHLAVVAFPGYAWIPVGKPLLAVHSVGLYLAAAMVAIACAGWTAAGIAAGVMIAIHAMGIIRYFFGSATSEGLRHRFLRASFFVLMVAAGYATFGRHLHETIVMPIHTESGIVLINRWAPVGSVAAGEVIAFQGAAWRSGNVASAPGTLLGRVVAHQGDVIVFQPEAVHVNGEPRTREAQMPRSGSVVVPSEHLFVWPLGFRGDFREAQDLYHFTRDVAMVPATQIVGRAYGWWFWRRTTL